MQALIEIDGAQGEGGGQILRTSLTLAACLGKSVAIRNIRANRPAGGLRPQHVTAARAVARVCGVELADLGVGQTELVFRPKPPKAGAYVFEVGTAGSTSLVLQTVTLPLALADGPSILKITGGTHNPKAPCFEYLAHVWVPFVREIGLGMGIGMQQAGFYPHGGGTVVAQIDGGTTGEALKPMNLAQRGEMTSLQGVVRTANCPINVGYGLRRAALLQIGRRGLDKIDMEIKLLKAVDEGAYCVVWAEFDRSRTAFVGVTGKGKTPEGAAGEAVGELGDFLDQEKSGGAALDPYAADQVMLPLALAPSTSAYTASKITDHCLTNAAVIEQITGRSVQIEGDKGKRGTITIT